MYIVTTTMLQYYTRSYLYLHLLPQDIITCDKAIRDIEGSVRARQCGREVRLEYDALHVVWKILTGMYLFVIGTDLFDVFCYLLLTTSMYVGVWYGDMYDDVQWLT